jgi:hypothetical protein
MQCFLDRVLTAFSEDIKAITIWSTVECGLGITAASCATLRPLLRRFTSHSGKNLISPGNTTYTDKDKSTLPLSTADKESRYSIVPYIKPLAFMLDRNKPQNFLLSETSTDSKRRSRLFSPVQSIDTINEETNQIGSGHFGEESQPRSFSKHSNDQLDSQRGMDSISKRATWWPLPRASLVMDKELESNTSTRL